MLIQNISNMAQAPQPVRLTSDGGPDAVVASPTTASAPVELPQIAAKQIAQPQPSATQLQNIVDGINKTLNQSNKNLEFSVDTDTKKPVIKLVDSETGDVIRQFPSEEALSISRSIDRLQQGLLLKQKA